LVRTNTSENILSDAFVEKQKEVLSESKLIITGDVMLGRTVMITSLEQNSDPTYPFSKVAERLRSADITFINLESPIIYDCPRYAEGFIFCANREMASGLQFSGVDIVNLANNHSRNFGSKGLQETTEILSERGILTTGLGKLVTIQKNDTTFGFLGFDFTVKNPTDADFDLISDSDQKVDVLVIAIHWGVEYTHDPTSHQKELAKKFVEKGADVIAGHHPHWVQPFDNAWSKDGTKKVIFYSLGNFVFDQMWSEETRRGVVVELSFRKKELTDIKTQETYMRKNGQPELL
jgi:poly-gamma-glutamate synthesis protein (capsule biosynthesis protein)